VLNRNTVDRCVGHRFKKKFAKLLQYKIEEDVKQGPMPETHRLAVVTYIVPQWAWQPR